MPTLYDTPSIVLRNARYRGHRESEKRLSSHHEQVHDIHRIANQVAEQQKEIDALTKQWFDGDVKENEAIVTIKVERSFKASASKNIYLLIDENKLRNITSLVVRLNNGIISSDMYKILHGSLYINIGEIFTVMPSSLVLSVSVTAEVFKKSSVNSGTHYIIERLCGIDERMKEAERKYLMYEDAYQ